MYPNTRMVSTTPPGNTPQLANDRLIGAELPVVTQDDLDRFYRLLFDDYICKIPAAQYSSYNNNSTSTI